jgi:hypothetical protein
MGIQMNLSIQEIYSFVFRGLKKNPVIYLLLFIWGFAQGIILAALLTVLMLGWLSTTIAAASLPQSGPAAVVILTFIFLLLALLIFGLMSAATRAGVLAFGARIREGGHASALDFFKGILRFTFPLFIGGIIVAMLSAIPVLLFLAVARITLHDVTPDIFTSGWDFAHALDLVGYVVNLALIFSALQAIVFFWITPWDKMVVLYKIPYPEALVRSFTFVFSRQNFHRVFFLVIINAIITLIAIVIGNARVIAENIPHGMIPAMLHIIAAASSSTLTSFFGFLLLPFFALSQLFLLPISEPDDSAELNITFHTPLSPEITGPEYNPPS